MKYPSTIVEHSTHSKANSYLIKSFKRKITQPPTCIPIVLSSKASIDGFYPPPTEMAYRINDGEIKSRQPMMLPDDATLKEILFGYVEGYAHHLPINRVSKFFVYGMGSEPITFFGGIDVNGIVQLHGHPVDLSDTTVYYMPPPPLNSDGVPDWENSRPRLFKIGKAERADFKFEIFKQPEIYSMYEYLTELPLLDGGYIPEIGPMVSPEIVDSPMSTSPLSIANPLLENDEPIVATSCGRFKLIELDPEAFTDLSEFDMGQYSLRMNSFSPDEEIITIDGDSRTLADIMGDSRTAVMHYNDGTLHFTDIGDGYYNIYCSPTYNRTPVYITVDISNSPNGSATIRRYPEDYHTRLSADEKVIDICLTPPAIAPFGASKFLGVCFSGEYASRFVDVQVKINGVDYGSFTLHDPSMAGAVHYVRAGEAYLRSELNPDNNMLVLELIDETEPGFDYTNYFKVELVFDDTAPPISHSPCGDGQYEWPLDLPEDNGSASYNPLTNTVTGFMKYITERGYEDQ